MKRVFLLVIAALFVVPPALAQSKGQILKISDYLKTGEYIVSQQKDHFAIMQGDGNFCVYKGTGPGDNKGYVWCSGKAPGKGQYFATMQGDANFCVYRGSGPADNKGLVWCTMSNRGTSDRYYAMLDISKFTIWQAPLPAPSLAIPILTYPTLIWKPY
jgi:hypothetical protein